METNNRNYKNPTVIAWEQLRQLLTQFADRMQNFDAMAQKQGRDIGVDEVFNEIQNIRKQLDEIQKGLNLQNNTINTERVVDKSQPETPFSITNNNRNDESKNMNKKLIRLTESDLHKIVKESVEKILSESEYDNFFDWVDNSSASPEEIEDAGQRHDSRIPSIKSPTDKLARRERVFNRRASMNDPDIGERIANRKDFIKNQRQGERFRQRITK